MAGHQQERGSRSLHAGRPRQGPSVRPLCSEHDGRLLGPSLLLFTSIAASSSSSCRRRRRACMLFLKHALATVAASAHACGTDSRTPGRSAEAGQTAELGPWIRETHPAARRLGSCAHDSTGSARPPAQARGRLRARRSSRDGLLPEEDESGPFVVSCSPQSPTVLSLPGPSPALSPSRTRALTACRAASQGDPRAESTLRAGSSSPAPPRTPRLPRGVPTLCSIGCGAAGGGGPPLVSSALSPAAPGPIPSRRGRKEGLGVAWDLNSRPLSLLGSVEGWVYWHSGAGGAGLGQAGGQQPGQGRVDPLRVPVALRSLLSAACACVYTYLWLLFRFGFVFV